VSGAVGGHAHGTRRVAAACLVAMLAVALTDIAAGAHGVAPATPSSPVAPGPCDWPMWGYSPARTFATRCPTRVTAATAPRLRLRWFTSTHDVVTATPALAHGVLYVGDWSGRVVALSARTGRVRCYRPVPRKRSAD